MHTKLATTRRRPELAILFAGHNEFSSRFDWGHSAYYYYDQIPPTPLTLQSLARRYSPLLRLIEETAQSLSVSVHPPHVITRQLVDVPVCTSEQYAERLTEFRARLGVMVTYLERIGAQVVLVIPPGNEAGLEPNRSFLPSSTLRADREAFASKFLAAREDESRNRLAAETAYLRLLEEQPRFAEGHFRLARMLEHDGRWDDAYQHYVAARDLDGMPFRLPSDYQQIYKDVGVEHPRATLIDGPAEFHAKAENGIVDDAFFADGLQPSLNGYTVLAQAILTKMQERRMFGWSADTPRPIVTPLACATHFQMNEARWQVVCNYTAWFYGRTAYLRYKPSERLAKEAKYGKAALELKAGVPFESVHLPGVGPLAPRE
jgi:hypothetical protein